MVTYVIGSRVNYPNSFICMGERHVFGPLEEKLMTFNMADIYPDFLICKKVNPGEAITLVATDEVEKTDELVDLNEVEKKDDLIQEVEQSSEIKPENEKEQVVETEQVKEPKKRKTK